MNPFLRQVAEAFYDRHGSDISRLAFVFPNQRAGLFFKKYLSEIAERPLFSPTILTITDLFIQLSGKQVADRISILFRLYTHYLRISGSPETFDEFLYWGEMLLNDFDDVDKYLVDARMLFTNVTDLKQIENDFSFLSEKQIAAIRTFWSTFHPKGDSVNQKQFLAVWEILYSLYDSLRKDLAADNKGYEGMIFRDVADNFDHINPKDLEYEKIIFVGLNALSTVEEKLLKNLQRMGVADFYWDYDSDKVRDRANRASYFVDRNRILFPSAFELREEDSKEDTQIEVIGIPSAIGQAKQVYSLLKAYSEEGVVNGEKALRTAVILPDEQLLIPVLNSIPEDVKSINVTMGYPLSGTPVASLVDSILSLQKNIRFSDGKPIFYFRDVLPILNHRYILSTAQNTISELVKQIVRNNRIYIQYEELSQTPLLETLFTPVTDTDGLSAYLIDALEKLNREVISLKAEDESETSKVNYQLESEFIFHYFTTVNRLKEVMDEAGIQMKPETYSRLLKRATETITIPFRGEPLSGLQIMGVLETRALDFDRLIILSMNDGIFPQRKTANSFIPYNLRRGFGLPTYEHQDSIWAYHFYRLLHRAKRVSLLYDTRTTGMQTGEVSRFVHQLRYHYEVPLQHKLVVYNVSSSQTPPIKMDKTEEIISKLKEFHKGGERALSASGINTYLDCPLKFYFSTIENVQEEEEVTESIESSMFGSILHKTLEDLYIPLRGMLVTADLLKLIAKDKKLLTHTIAKAFATEFFKSEVIRPLTGQNFLISEMIRKYVEKVLEHDRKITPFHYIESEKRMNDLFTLSDGTEIQLKGFIDRIDDVKDSIRIIDYKSGGGVSSFKHIETLFSKEEKERPKAIMQVFMYAWMYSRLPENKNRMIQPGIYYMRTLFTPGFSDRIMQKEERGKAVPVENFADYYEPFEEGMRTCLDEIFTNQTPFEQTPNGKACSYCQFKTLCGK